MVAGAEGVVMSERAVKRMTADAFLAWHEGQEQRYELLDGVPVAMAGGGPGAGMTGRW